MEIAKLQFNWTGLHIIDAVSRSVISAVESRLLGGALPRPDSTPLAGAPSSTGSSPSGGSRPPAARPGPRGTAATPPTPPRRNKRSAPADLLLVGSNKSIRTLRSQKLQTRLAQVHEAAVAAMMEDDAHASVVKPHYVVYEVDPFLLWPDGGVIVYAQFPFLLDDSWRSTGLCISYCRKVLCDPDPTNMGGTYEAVFSMDQADIQQLQASARDQGRGASSSRSPRAPPGPASSAPSTPPSAPPAASTPGVAQTPPTTTDAPASVPVGHQERAAPGASASTDPLLSTGGSAMNRYEDLDEEELDYGGEAPPPGLPLGPSPASATSRGMLAGVVAAPANDGATAVAAAITAAAAAAPPGPLSPGSGALSTLSAGLAGVDEVPVAERAPADQSAAAAGPRAASAIGAAVAAAATAALSISGGPAPAAAPTRANPAAATLGIAGIAAAPGAPNAATGAALALGRASGDTARPVRAETAMAAGSVSAGDATAGTSPADAGARARAATRPPVVVAAAVRAHADGATAPAAAAPQQPRAVPQLEGGRPQRQRGSSGQAEAPPPPPVKHAAPAGLHEHFQDMLHMTNADMGFDTGEVITVRKLAQSPKPTFAMRCAFACSLDLETVGSGASTARFDNFFVAAYRARPGHAPVTVHLVD